jgi:BASS family bile acid:Na+ symporter
MLEKLQSMDNVILNFSQDSLLALNITIGLIMFGVALGIETDHFKRLFKRPRPVATGFISQFVLLPAVTFLLTIALKNVITPTMALGMILVAACPGGNISNFMSALSKGNAALSVSLTAIATISAIILTPLNFALYGGWFMRIYENVNPGLLPELDIPPLEVFKTVLLIIGIPLLLGMYVNTKFKKFTAIIAKPLKIFSIVAFLGMVGIAFKSNYDFFLQFVKYVFFLVLAHNIIAFGTGYSFATLMKVSPFDRRAITFETGIQNSALGLALLFNPKIFPPELAIGGMTVVVAWWGLWHILSGLTTAGIWARIPLKGGNEE